MMAVLKQQEVREQHLTVSKVRTRQSPKSFEHESPVAILQAPLSKSQIRS